MTLDVLSNFTFRGEAVTAAGDDAFLTIALRGTNTHYIETPISASVVGPDAGLVLGGAKGRCFVGSTTQIGSSCARAFKSSSSNRWWLPGRSDWHHGVAKQDYPGLTRSHDFPGPRRLSSWTVSTCRPAERTSPGVVRSLRRPVVSRRRCAC